MAAGTAGAIERSKRKPKAKREGPGEVLSGAFFASAYLAYRVLTAGFIAPFRELFRRRRELQ